jgi:integrase
MEEKPEQVLRFAIATIYGCRVGELAMLSNANIDLDHGEPVINIPTLKKGKRLPQPIPAELIPLFKLPLHPRKSYNIQADLRRLCRKAGIPLFNRMGIHTIRRSVVTALYSHTNLKELSIRRFMRWSEGGRGMGVMPRYVKTPVDVTDKEVLAAHPFVKFWKDYVLFLPYLPQYVSCVQNMTFSG